MLQLSLDRKFALVCATLVASTLMLGGIGALTVDHILATVRSLTTDSLPRVWIMGQVRAALLQVQNEGWRHIASYDAKDMTMAEQNIERLKGEIAGLLQQFEKTISNAEDRKHYEKIRPLYDAYMAAWEQVRVVSRSGIGAAAHQKFVDEADPAFTSLMEAVAAQLEYTRHGADLYRASAIATAGNVQFWTRFLVVACSLLGSGLAFATVRSLKRVMSAAIGEMAQGVAKTRQVADQVSASSQLVAGGAARQSASLVQTSASAEEMNSVSARCAEGFRAAAEMAAGSQQHFQETSQALDQMVHRMNEIQGSSGRISKIIAVIDGIAFQTNILALNAAVEAARAGEAGLGFAVVAEEVRNLAGRCAQAARETGSLIQESIAKSDEGKAQVERVDRAIRLLAEESARIKALVDELAAASQQHTRSVEQIAHAVTQMDRVTQGNASSAQKSASSAAELNSQAEALSATVRRLAGLVGLAVRFST